MVQVERPDWIQNLVFCSALSVPLIEGALVFGVLPCSTGAANLVGSLWPQGCAFMAPSWDPVIFRRSHYPFLLGLENSHSYPLEAYSQNQPGVYPGGFSEG